LRSLVSIRLLIGCSLLPHQNKAGDISAQSVGMPLLTLYYLHPPAMTLSTTLLSSSYITRCSLWSRMFTYLSAHRVLICVEHQHAVYGVNEHLKWQHSLSAAKRREMLAAYTSSVINAPEHVSLPAPSSVPIAGLCERSVGTVFQLPNPDAIYSRDEGKERW
jgi:hypothetical protein